MIKNLNTLIVALAVAFVATPAFSTPGQYGGVGYPHMFGNFGPAGMFLGPIFMIAWIVVLVALVVLILKWMGVIRKEPHRTGSTAFEILDERFARGEIDKKQFEAMRNQLSS